jgi:hypothetical protein
VCGLCRVYAKKKKVPPHSVKPGSAYAEHMLKKLSRRVNISHTSSICRAHTSNEPATRAASATTTLRRTGSWSACICSVCAEYKVRICRTYTYQENRCRRCPRAAASADRRPSEGKGHAAYAQYMQCPCVRETYLALSATARGWRNMLCICSVQSISAYSVHILTSRWKRVP